ncbi:MAG: glycosyltransferase family 2 protein, partial [Cellvibrionales bacterium]|nr:glycosyltransferase family 2 protein [Cellvibrionales bacterium]
MKNSISHFSNNFYKLLNILFGWIVFQFKFTFDVKAGRIGGVSYENDKIYQMKKKIPFILYLRDYYMLEIIRSNDKSAPVLNLILYSDVGEGGGELCVCEIDLSKNISKKVCYFEKPVRSLRFELSSANLSPEILDIKLTKLTKKFALSRIKKKLGLENSSGYHDIETLYKEYDKLFKPKEEPSYAGWIREQEPSLWLPELPKKFMKFSIIVPIFNSRPEWLDACIYSVINQTYTNFELILVDDASSKALTIDSLNKHAASDSRIKLITRIRNGHISVATNTGIGHATGDFFIFLDHDDQLSLNALNEVAHVIENNPNAQIIYSDEDLMSDSGERITPHFKPDWNADLLLGHNYVTHLCCYKQSLLTSLGGFREGFEGAQDYDLILRASKVVDPENIFHIPKILYHWRMVESSTALDASAKPYTDQAGLLALKEHVSSISLDLSVSTTDKPNFYQVNWPVDESIKLSVIIPTRDGLDVLQPCIETLFSTTQGRNIELIILDNGSSLPETLNYFEKLKLQKNVVIIRDDNPFNYSNLNNQGVSESTGHVLLFLNNDIEALSRGWLDEMLSQVVRPNIGCVGAKLLYPDRTIQHAGVIMGLGGYAAHSHRGLANHSSGYFNRLNLRQNISAVTGACLMVRREIFELVGGFDSNFAVAYNDVDFCLKVKRAGFDNVFTPFAELIHHESKTRGEESAPADIHRFQQEKDRLQNKWPDIINHDPAYNPNLTRMSEDFTLKRPHEF